MTGDIMKSSVVESNRVKIDGRQSVHRRKMSKNSPIVNGAAVSDSVVGYEDENLVIRQVNLAAAYHDHISCTKSVDLCRIPDTKESRANLPCETDHIYANCSDKSNKSHSIVSSPSKDRNEEKRHLQEMCLIHLELIRNMKEENIAKDKQIEALKKENELLKVRQERMERRIFLMKKSVKSDDESDAVSDVESSISDSQPSPNLLPFTSDVPTQHTAVNLVTRYFGRRSKTVPSRALKRRYFGPPKILPCKKLAIKPSSTATVTSGNEETKPVVIKSEPAPINSAVTIAMPSISEPGQEVRKIKRKRSRRLKVIPRMEDFLSTDKEYFLPDKNNFQSSFDMPENIHVPSWRFHPVPSFYQMEGTENIDDRVFHRRHLKCEQDEKRRKRWDLQRLREQKASEKFKYKNGTGYKWGGDGFMHKNFPSLYPNPNKIEYIEVTEKLPVLAFGQPIPLFQPSEFSLPWKVGDFREPEKTKKSASATRVT